MKTYADLVDLAESGDTEGRVDNKIWRLVEVSNRPGTFVYSSKSTTWCYSPEDLLHNEKLRNAIRRTAEMRNRAKS